MRAMTDEIFEIIRTAITVASNEQIRAVSKLRVRLAQLYPGKESEIDSALQAWAAQERRTGMAY